MEPAVTGAPVPASARFRRSKCSNAIAGIIALMSAVVLVSVSFLGCQTSQPSVRAEGPPARVPYILASGDTVTIAFIGAPELNQQQRIRPDGKLNLPLVGEVRAAGKSVAQLQQDLTRLYEPQLKNTSVQVGLLNTAAAVYVTGAVNGPRKVVLDRPMTALEAIMEAGGFVRGLANTKKVLLVRQSNGRHETQTLDLSPGALSRQTGVVFLQPYDMIIVQERMF